MVPRGKVTKTEIFCLSLTAVFLLTVLVLFWTGRSSRAETGVTTWKGAAEEITPQKIHINTADEEELQLLLVLLEEEEELARLEQAGEEQAPEK